MISWNIPTVVSTKFSSTKTEGGPFEVYENFPTQLNETIFNEFSLSLTSQEYTLWSFDGPEGTETDTQFLVQYQSTYITSIVSGEEDGENVNENNYLSTRAFTAPITTSTTKSEIFNIVTTSIGDAETTIWSTSINPNNQSTVFYSKRETINSTITAFSESSSTYDTTTEKEETQTIGNTWATVWQCRTSDAFAEIIWSRPNKTTNGNLIYEAFSEGANSTTRATFEPWLKTIVNPREQTITVAKDGGQAYLIPLSEEPLVSTINYTTTGFTQTTLTFLDKSVFPVKTFTESFDQDQQRGKTTVTGSIEIGHSGYSVDTAGTEPYFTTTFTDTENPQNTEFTHISDIVYLKTNTIEATYYFISASTYAAKNESLEWKPVTTFLSSSTKIIQKNYDSFGFTNSALELQTDAYFKIKPAGINMFAITYGPWGSQINNNVGSYIQIDAGVTFSIPNRQVQIFTDNSGNPNTSYSDTPFITAFVNRAKNTIYSNTPTGNLVTLFPQTFVTFSTASAGEKLAPVSVSLNPPSITISYIEGTKETSISSIAQLVDEPRTTIANSRMSLIGGGITTGEFVCEGWDHGVFVDQNGGTISKLPSMESRNFSMPTTWYHPIPYINPDVSQEIDGYPTFLSYTELRNTTSLPPNSHLPL